MPSRFGDEPIQQAPRSRFGDAPVDQPTTPLSLVPGTPGSGSAGRFVSGFTRAVNPIPGIKAIATDPQGLKHGIETNIFEPQADQFSKAADAIHGRGEFAGMSPIGRASEVAGHGLAGALPLVGPAAANAGDRIGNGDVAGGLGETAGLIAPMLTAPPLAKSAGKAFEASARPLVKSALRLPGRTEAYGATPATAVLEETPWNALKPETIAETARRRVGTLNSEAEALARASRAKPSLTPPRSVIKDSMAAAAAGNSEASPHELAPMLKQLTEVRPGFAGATKYPQGSATPISFTQTYNPQTYRPSGMQVVAGTSPDPVVSTKQTALPYLRMKRQFNKDFIGNWNPDLHSGGALQIAKQAYGAMATELHQKVPGLQVLDQRMQSLIPAAEWSERAARGPSLAETAINRTTRPTGGLFPMIFGFHERGLPGAMTVMAGQEALGSPVLKMAAARALYGTGKAVGSAPVQRLAQTAPLIRSQDTR